MYFGELGDRQVHLLVLTIHRDCQRHSAGAKLRQWGMDISKDLKVPATPFSSPGGQKLYAYMGFEYLGSVTVQTEGENEKLLISAMIHRA
ncbi:hypothetical protein BDY21DRAFT_147503 [Lineolata rhizophorae]|uniref:N-acetyltransferase domain-containing protein n=1 Tax=Lineolata rhizophorae TaxID=578093 RepID=A0A6A6NMJ6_9PEZI|nr:hypothetical protein BDY21DRAFT_147503 [Lineolata rhizophorae]